MSHKFLFSIFFALTLPCLSSATPFELKEILPPKTPQGSYTVTTPPVAKMRLDVRVIHTLTNEGKQQRKKLKEQGYECRPSSLSHWHRCVLQTRIDQLPSEIEQTLLQKYENFYLIFNENNHEAKTHLLSAGEGHYRWQVFNTVRSPSRHFDSYEIWENPKFDKIVIGPSTDSYTLIRTDETDSCLALKTRTAQRFSDRQWSEYFADVLVCQ